jgi:hypothetical protein
MDRLELLLVFSETINISSFDVTQVTVQNRRLASDATHTLTGGAASAVNRTSALIAISEEDGNELKRLVDLATSIGSTFVTLSNSTVADMSGNAIVGESSVQASAFVADSTQPTLVAVALDLSRDVVNLTFSETIDASSFNYTELSLQSDGTLAASARVKLSAPQDYTPEGAAVVLSLSIANDDLNDIKRHSSLCVSVATCFVSFSGGLIDDVSGNAVESTVRKVDAFVPDDVAPELTAFGLFVDLGVLTLTFSESVDIGSINVSSVSMQDETGLTSVSLTSTSEVGSASKQFVNISVSGDDMDRFKLNLGAVPTIFIKITADTILDTNTNRVLATTIVTADYAPDSFNPTLTSFKLDMDSGLLELEFDEIMDIDSLRRHLFQMLSEASDDADTVPLE